MPFLYIVRRFPLRFSHVLGLRDGELDRLLLALHLIDNGSARCQVENMLFGIYVIHDEFRQRMFRRGAALWYLLE